MLDYDAAEQERQAILNGNNVAHLINDPGFRLVMDLLGKEKELAIQDLCTVAPTDSAQIQKLQNIIWRHDEFVHKLSVIMEVKHQTEADTH